MPLVLKSDNFSPLATEAISRIVKLENEGKIDEAEACFIANAKLLSRLAWHNLALSFAQENQSCHAGIAFLFAAEASRTQKTASKNFLEAESCFRNSDPVRAAAILEKMRFFQIPDQNKPEKMQPTNHQAKTLRK